VKRLFALSLILCLGSSSAWAVAVSDPAPPESWVPTASPNRISAAEPCPTLARRFLIRGSYDSSDIGSRLWDLAKIRNTSPQSDQEKVCLDEISKQADSDESDYWVYIAHKYKCDDDQGDVPKTKPSACPEAKWQLISGNVNWLNSLGAVPADESATQEDADCKHPSSSSFRPQLKTASDVGAVVQNVPGAHPETPEPTVDSHTDLGTILAQPTANKCSFVTDRTKLNSTVCNLLYKDDKSCGITPSSARDAGKCIEGLVKGIGNSIKDLFLDTVHMVVGAGSKIKAFLEALYKGGRGTIAREYAFHPKEVLAHVWDALKGLPDAIMNMASTQQQTWECYNNAARWDMSCSAVGYLGMDALMFVPGFQELAITQLSKIEKLRKVFEVVDAVKEATVGKAIANVKSVGKAGLALLAEGAIVTGETTFKILKWVGKASKAAYKKLFWFRDSSTGLMVAKDGPSVLVKLGDNVEEVTSATEAAKIGNAIDYVAKNRSLAKVETDAAKRIAEEDAAHAGTATAPKPPTEAVTPGAAAPADAPKPGFFRRALNNFKDPDTKMNQMEIKLSKEYAPLPKSYILDDTHPTSTFDEWAAKARTESTRAADFIGMKATGSGTAVIKDAKGVEQTFTYSEDGKGLGWFTKGKLPEKLNPNFLVNIDIPPEKMAKALPGILSRAEYRGAETYFIGGSSRALESGGRLMISFKTAKQAKRFQDSVEFFIDRNLYSVPSRVEGAGLIANAKWAGKVVGKITHLTVMRPMTAAMTALYWGSRATVQSTVLSCMESTNCKRHVITSETVFQDAKTKCKNDNLCICQLYFQAGINPDTDEPIETSPFTCTTATVNPNLPGAGGDSTEEVHKEIIGTDGKPIILQTTDHSGESDDGRAARLQKEFNDAAQKAADDPNGDVQPDTGPIGPPGQNAPTP
jgi:hypothetical protein